MTEHYKDLELVSSTKLTRKEIAKVFSIYGVNSPVKTVNGTGELYAIYDSVIGVRPTDVDFIHAMLRKGYTDTYYKYVPSSDVRLILSPLSKITDEDAMEVKEFLKEANTVWEISEYTRNDISKYLLEKGIYLYSHISQYLILKSYAVPLFFTPNHWANGKDALELGIAIEK